MVGLGFLVSMTTPLSLTCDGCGQLAPPAHLARRLQRLEWTTRYRPLHIQVLLLGGISPEADPAFLYFPNGSYDGEAANLLGALGISREGRSPDAILTDFQKRGLLLTHVLECPLEPGVTPSIARQLLEKQLPAAIVRIRRSLKPKRLVLFSGELAALMTRFTQAAVGCPVLTGSYGLLSLDPAPNDAQVNEFRRVLGTASAP